MYLGRSQAEAISEGQTPEEMNHSNRNTLEGQGPCTTWPVCPDPLPSPPQPSFLTLGRSHQRAPLSKATPHPSPPPVCKLTLDGLLPTPQVPHQVSEEPQKLI